MTTRKDGKRSTGDINTGPDDAAQAGEFLTALGPNPQLQDPVRSLSTQSACWTRRLTSAATDQSYPCFSGRLIPAAMDWMVRYNQDDGLDGACPIATTVST